MSSFLLKKHVSGTTTVISVCDADLLGKTFEEGVLVLAVIPPFYDGERAPLETVIQAIKSATTATIVGNVIVEKLVSEGLVKESGVHEIRGIKHAHIYRL